MPIAPRRLVVLALAALLVLTVGACADDGQPQDASDTSTVDTRDTVAPDTAPDDTAAPDAADTAEVVEPGSCAALAVAGNAFAIDSAGPATQIHPAVAFDGSGVWITWVQPDGQGEGGFDVMASRLTCSGARDIAPFHVHPPSATNEIDPELAIGADGAVLVVWQRDKSATEPDDPANLDIVYTLLEPDGSPRLAAPQVLETTRAGTPVTGNAWSARVATRPQGKGFVIAGTRGDDTHQCFLAFAQRLDAQGALAGEAVDAGVDAVACDSNPAVTVDASDTIALSFTRQPTIDDSSTPLLVTIAAQASAPSAPPAPLIDGVDGASSSLAQLPDGRLLRAVDTPDGAIVVGDGELRVALGLPDANEVAPGLALSADGARAAVFYYRMRSGFQADVVVHTLDVANGGLAKGNELVVTGDAPSAPYGPAIAHVAGDTWLVAWPEGMSPAFMARARLVAP